MAFISLFILTGEKFKTFNADIQFPNLNKKLTNIFELHYREKSNIFHKGVKMVLNS